MTRLIDADEIRWADHYDSDGNLSKYKVAYSDEMPPAVDAVPTEFVMENCNLEFVCEALTLTDDDEWCSKRCQYSEPPSECIHRYIERIWRKEHDRVN